MEYAHIVIAHLMKKIHYIRIVWFSPEVLAEDLVNGPLNPERVIHCHQSHTLLKENVYDTLVNKAGNRLRS